MECVFVPLRISVVRSFASLVNTEILNSQAKYSSDLKTIGVQY